jgi:hypothetical protein
MPVLWDQLLLQASMESFATGAALVGIPIVVGENVVVLTSKQ